MLNCSAPAVLAVTQFVKTNHLQVRDPHLSNTISNTVVNIGTVYSIPIMTDISLRLLDQRYSGGGGTTCPEHRLLWVAWCLTMLTIIASTLTTLFILSDTVEISNEIDPSNNATLTIATDSTGGHTAAGSGEAPEKTIERVNSRFALLSLFL